MPSDDVLYRIGSADELAWVGGGWDEFAARNGAPGLTGGRVLGRSLWAFVSDPPTQVIYRAVLARVRGGSPVAFPLRCDSPGARRSLAVQVSPAPGGEVAFRARVVREEERSAVPLLDPAAARSDRMVRMCGWCNRVYAGEWVEVEEGVARLGLFEGPAVPAVTHGMCEDCAGRMTALLDRSW